MQTVCPYCGVGCMLYLRVVDGSVIGVLPHEKGPGEGRLCIKGWSANEFIQHPDRLTKPLVKRHGKFVEASWSEALEIVAERLQEVKSKHGPDSVAFLSSAKATNEESYLLQRFARAVVGTNNVDNCARLCHASTIVGLSRAFGGGAMTNSQEDIEEADAIFVIGSNTSEQHPLIARRIVRAAQRGTRLIVADPRSIDLTAYAAVHLKHRPGTDVALVNAMMNVILAEGLHDEEFIRDRTEGFDALRERVRKYGPELAEQITGVPADEIREAAILYARAEKATIFFSMGITQHTTGVDNVVSLANLAMLCGNVGKRGAGVNPLRGQNNVQGNSDMGALPDLLPGYRSVDDRDARERFGMVWGAECPVVPGLTAVEMVDECGRAVRAMYVMGENPMITDPDINHVKRQLERLDFLVVTELFLTETARIADVVLPAASFAEKDGTFTATDRRVQRIRKAIEPVGESHPDWLILTQLATAMRHKLAFSSPEEIMDEIAKLVLIYGGISYCRLEDTGIKWPCPDTGHPGTDMMHVDRFTRGKGLFIPVDYRHPAEEPDADYPFTLTTGRVLFHWHAGSMTRRSPTLTAQLNEAYVEVNPRDADALGVSDGEVIRVRSRRGEITLKTMVTGRVREGVVFIPFHFAESAANALTNAALDPEAKIPEYKVCAVRMEKLLTRKIVKNVGPC